MEEEIRKSPWLNPLVLGLFAATLGFMSNVWVTSSNNRNSQQIERMRSQSNLILESIKTGNTESNCKNLSFFVRLGLLDDPQNAIQNVCQPGSKEAPALPANGGQNFLAWGRVVDETHSPIAGATVATLLSGKVANTSPTTVDGLFTVPFFPATTPIEIQVSKPGYTTKRLLVIVGSGETEIMLFWKP